MTTASVRSEVLAGVGPQQAAAGGLGVVDVMGDFIVDVQLDQTSEASQSLDSAVKAAVRYRRRNGVTGPWRVQRPSEQRLDQ